MPESWAYIICATCRYFGRTYCFTLDVPKCLRRVLAEPDHRRNVRLVLWIDLALFGLSRRLRGVHFSIGLALIQSDAQFADSRPRPIDHHPTLGLVVVLHPLRELLQTL